MPTVGFHTLGCKVNQQETAALAAKFKQAGFDEVDFSQQADVYVINSCAVTTEAERKSLTLARRKKNQTQGFVVLAGCFPQVALDKAGTAGVDLLVGSNDKSRIVELVTLSLSGYKGPLVHVSEWSKDTHFEIISDTSSIGRTRATLKVQDGCEQFCAYCIIPYARGPERSLPIHKVVEQSKLLEEQGFKEIVLSGIHLGAYGRDLTSPVSLTTLLSELLKSTDFARIRLGSVEPNDVDEALIAILAQETAICRHLHLPLQSGCDEVLKRMNRRYTTSEFLALVERLRAAAPGIGITSDLIVGFPGETDVEFAETLAFVEKMNFLRLHVFRYSARSGTPAATMHDQVPEHVKEERLKRIQQAAEQCALRFHRSLLGQKVEVLVENEHERYFVGHTSSYVKVFLEGTPNLSGKLVEVEISSASIDGVYGQLSRSLSLNGE